MKPAQAKHVERLRCGRCGFIVMQEQADPRQQVILGAKACPRCGVELLQPMGLASEIAEVTNRRLRTRAATPDVTATREQFEADALDVARVASKFWGDEATRLLERAASVASTLAARPGKS